ADGFRPSDLVLRGSYENAAVYFDKKLKGSAAAELGLESIDINEITVNAFNEVLKARNLKVDASRLYEFLMSDNWEGVWKLLMEVGQ
ncbi:MAG: hypothetical protein GOV00_00725, partial [Candidatus Altiarchaeota archaeon]|nr:hypothetical protein [Candidatus Altiarchaeota archaeon]